KQRKYNIFKKKTNLLNTRRFKTQRTDYTDSPIFYPQPVQKFIHRKAAEIRRQSGNPPAKFLY
ncbi:TPA: hypothetical protein ACKN5Q_002154, partial [Neisseria gonorrhoeae]